MGGLLGSLLPLVLLVGFVGGFGWIGYQMYLYAHDMTERGRKHMEKKNISFTKEGMKVGVKEVRSEDYEDKTQSLLVKTWNMASESNRKASVSPRPGASRTSSVTSGARPVAS